MLSALAPRGAAVAGQGFGALIALDLLRRHGELARAAVLTDTPLLALVPDAARRSAEARESLEAALRDGGPAAGVDGWLEGRRTASSARGRASMRARSSPTTRGSRACP